MALTLPEIHLWADNFNCMYRVANQCRDARVGGSLHSNCLGLNHAKLPVEGTRLRSVLSLGSVMTERP